MIAIFLDLDGTLIDPMPGITGAIRYALGEMGAEVPDADALTWCIGPPIRQNFDILLGPGADLEAAVEHYREHFAAGAMYEAELYDGVGEMLLDLRATGAGLWLATSKAEDFATKIVEHFDIAPLIDGVFGSRPDGSLADKPTLLAHALAETEADAVRSVMLGDRRFDVEGARANGLAAIGALWGYGEEGELHLAEADALAAAPEDVLDLVADLLGLEL